MTPEEIAAQLVEGFLSQPFDDDNVEPLVKRIAKAITDERQKHTEHLNTLRARVKALEKGLRQIIDYDVDTGCTEIDIAELARFSKVTARTLLAANEEPKPVEERAEELADEINRLFDSAIENSCTCGSAPEDNCRFCSAWGKAEKKTTALILAALTEDGRWASKQPASDNVEEKANTLADVITQTAKAVGKPDPEGWNPDGWQSFLEWLRAELTEAMTCERCERCDEAARASSERYGDLIDERAGLIAERDTLRRQVEQLENALRLILPMAKGYAYSHRLGSNLNYIDIAESALSPVQDAEPVRRLEPVESFKNRGGHLCFICDGTDAHSHPQLKCSVCGAVGLAENMPGHNCAEQRSAQLGRNEGEGVMREINRQLREKCDALEQKLGVSRAEDWLVLKERIAELEKERGAGCPMCAEMEARAATHLQERLAPLQASHAGLRERCVELERERDKWREMLCIAEQERDNCRAIIKSNCEDIRDLARPLLGKFLTDGDSMGAPSPVDIVKSLVARINGLVKGLEQERDEAGRELKERIARIATLEEERDHQTHLTYEFRKALRQAEKALEPLAEKAKWWNSYYPQERGSSPLAVPLRNCRTALTALAAIRKALGEEQKVC